MTVVIGIHGGDFAMIGADSRGTTIDGEGKHSYDDTVEKVDQSGFGVISGAGYEAMMRLVCAGMKFADGPDEFGDVIADALSASKGSEHHERARALTRWIYSYKDAQGKLMIGQYRAAATEPDSAFGPYSVSLIAPAGMTDADEALLRSKLVFGAAMRDMSLTVLERAERAGRIIQSVVKFCATLTQTVGPSFQLGFHPEHHAIRISNVMSRIEETKWRTPENF